MDEAVPTNIVVTCPSCGHGTVFQMPWPFHAGYGDQGFLYNEAGDRTLIWSSFDPDYQAAVGSKPPWALTDEERQKFEDRLPPAPSGGRWLFRNPARCVRCGNPISGPITETTYYLRYDGSVDRDVARGWGPGRKGMLKPAAPAAPWRPRDVWLGVVMAAVLMGAGYALVFVLRGLHAHPNVDLWYALFPTLFELVLLVPVWWFAGRKYHAPLRALGFRKFPGSVLGIGVGLLFAFYFASGIYNLILHRFGLQAQPDIRPVFGELASPWPLIFSTVIVAPLVEETFFRGFVFNGLRSRFHWAWAAAISAALFAAAHLEIWFFLPAFALGFLFAFLYQRSNSVWPGMALHFILNSIAMIGILVLT